MRRHAVIVSLKADHGDFDIVRFLRVARSFVHKVRKELEKENNKSYVMKGGQFMSEKSKENRLNGF